MLAVNTYMFKVGDLVRRHQVGEPEQMFMFDVQNLGVVTQTIDGSHAEALLCKYMIMRATSLSPITPQVYMYIGSYPKEQPTTPRIQPRKY